MKITNISKGPRGVNTASGPVLIETGQTIDAELSEAELKVAKKTEWFEFGNAVATKKTDPADKPAFEAKHKGRGSYSIFDVDGNEVKEGLTKDEVEAFEVMSPEEQAAFVAVSE